MMQEHRTNNSKNSGDRSLVSLTNTGSSGIRRALPLLLLVVTAMQLFSACEALHQYPSYRGRVLELGTDSPIEGAGVLTIYYMTRPSFGGKSIGYLGYQAALSDNTGIFIIPAKWFLFPFPLTGFQWEPMIYIYKHGYGNYPGSFVEYEFPDYHGETDPPLKGTWGTGMPADREVIFRLPKIRPKDNDLKFKYIGRPPWPDDRNFPPRGITPSQLGFE